LTFCTKVYNIFWFTYPLKILTWPLWIFFVWPFLDFQLAIINFWNRITTIIIPIKNNRPIISLIGTHIVTKPLNLYLVLSIKEVFSALLLSVASHLYNSAYTRLMKYDNSIELLVGLHWCTLLIILSWILDAFPQICEGIVNIELKHQNFFTPIIDWKI
jgi:hypothetical protein